MAPGAWVTLAPAPVEPAATASGAAPERPTSAAPERRASTLALALRLAALSTPRACSGRSCRFASSIAEIWATCVGSESTMVAGSGALVASDPVCTPGNSPRRKIRRRRIFLERTAAACTRASSMGSPCSALVTAGWDLVSLDSCANSWASLATFSGVGSCMTVTFSTSTR